MEWSLLSNGTQPALSNGYVLIKMPYFCLAPFVLPFLSHQSWISRFYLLPSIFLKLLSHQTKTIPNCFVLRSYFKWFIEVTYYLFRWVVVLRFCSLTLLRRNSVFFFDSPSEILFSLFQNRRRKAFLPSSISYALSRNHQFHHFLDSKRFLDNSIKQINYFYTFVLPMQI